jgi:hypothetical protein
MIRYKTNEAQVFAAKRHGKSAGCGVAGIRFLDANNRGKKFKE